MKPLTFHFAGIYYMPTLQDGAVAEVRCCAAGGGINNFKENRKMDKAVKQEIIKKYARKEGDTGSPEVQIALLSNRISALTEHLRTNKKDHSTRRGLLAMVALRKKLLSYLARENRARYISLTDELGIRRAK
jgi:small subunit ribosomal protein S15